MDLPERVVAGLSTSSSSSIKARMTSSPPELMDLKTCKRWQAAHLHLRKTFENLLHIAPLRRTLSGILQFEIWTMISLLYSGPRYGSVQFMFSKGKLCKLSRTFKTQQTICSVRAYSCWICGPFMRFVYSKIREKMQGVTGRTSIPTWNLV